MPTAPAGSLTQRLQEVLTAALARHKVPGAAVAVRFKGRDHIACGGVTSVWNPSGIEPSTLFQVGSVGKVYTATAIMQLVARGQVQLGAPVRTYLDGLILRDSSVAEQITLLQLLNHTAGFDGDFFPDTGYGDDALERFVDRLHELDQVLPLGRLAVYNNTAFSVAGRVIEVVTGLPFPQAMRELVFEPLGLTETHYFPWEVMLHRFAIPHMADDSGYSVGQIHEPRCLQPSGGELSASIRDFLKFARAHLDGGVAGEPFLDSVAGMRLPTANGGGLLGDHVGVAWQLTEAGGRLLAEHGGKTIGQQAKLVLAPDDDFALVLLSNSNAAAGLLDEIEAMVLEECLGVARPAPQPLQVDAATLSEFAGTYKAMGQRLLLEVEDHHLGGTVHLDPEAWKDIFPEGMDIPPTLDMPVSLLPQDGLVIVGGPYEGGRGRVVRDLDGRVEGLMLGGRYLARQAT